MSQLWPSPGSYPPLHLIQTPTNSLLLENRFKQQDINLKLHHTYQNPKNTPLSTPSSDHLIYPTLSSQLPNFKQQQQIQVQKPIS
jgi:hypothetical protein